MTILSFAYSPLRVLLASSDGELAADLVGALSRLQPAGQLVVVSSSTQAIAEFEQRPYDAVFLAADDHVDSVLRRIFELSQARASFIFGGLLVIRAAPRRGMQPLSFFEEIILPLRPNVLGAKLHAIQALRQLWMGHNETSRLQQAMLENTAGGALLVSADGVILQNNIAAERLLGGAPGNLIGCDYRTRLAGKGHALMPPMCLSQHPLGQLVLFRGANPTPRGIADGEYLSAPDALTGLPAPLLLQHRLKNALLSANKSHRNMGLMLVAVDDFAEINRTYGYTAGDQVLCAVAQRLSNVVNMGDTVSRDSGGRFIVLLQNLARPEDALLTASHICHDCREPIALTGFPPVEATVSIGVARFPEHGRTSADLLRCAEAALMTAKQTGRAHVCSYTPAAEEAVINGVIEGQLLAALDNQEFELHYQPQVSLTGRVIGAEALLRWNHLGELRFPDTFLPLAAAIGIMDRITQWVVRTAVCQLAAWNKQGLRMVVAVNVSPREVTDELLALVKTTLAEAEVDPAQLEIEITESALAVNPVEAARILNELNALGVRLALDDFGTGYSSLAHLKSFPLHVLKIDRSFIMSIQESSLRDEAACPHSAANKDLAIVRTIIALANNLNLATTAEGVELPGQLAVLSTLGVTSWQGYYAAKAMPAKNFPAWAYHWAAMQVPQA